MSRKKLDRSGCNEKFQILIENIPRETENCNNIRARDKRSERD